jgi:nucleolar protein 56
MAKLATTWFATFIIDNDKVVDKRLFPKEAEAIADRLARMDEGAVLDEENGLAGAVAPGAGGAAGGALEVSEERLKGLGRMSAPPALDLTALAGENGFGPELLRDAMMALGKRRIGHVAEDRFVIQAVGSIDDLNRTANILSERLHEWFSYHFPELGRTVAEERYAELVATHGDREAIAKALGLQGGSVGAGLTDDDKEVLRMYASSLSSVYKTRAGMEAYIGRRMAVLAPNLTHLAGPIIGARLLALAGGMERLGRMPSSTIQMLGAEKAFFRHVAEGGEMPKHGVIFLHPLVHSSPWWQRGRVARAFANKIALAAKTDLQTKRFIGDDLKASLDKRMEEIRRTLPNAPPQKEKPGRRPEGRGRLAGRPGEGGRQRWKGGRRGMGGGHEHRRGDRRGR